MHTVQAEKDIEVELLFQKNELSRLKKALEVMGDNVSELKRQSLLGVMNHHAARIQALEWVLEKDK